VDGCIDTGGRSLKRILRERAHQSDQCAHDLGVTTDVGRHERTGVQRACVHSASAVARLQLLRHQYVAKLGLPVRDHAFEGGRRDGQPFKVELRR
jgi:hypothetical protein